MLLQPQALAQHLLHGIADGIFIAADNRLDLHARGAQALLQCIGGVQHVGHGTLAAAATLPRTPREARCEHGDQKQHDNGQVGTPGRQVLQSAVSPGAGQIAPIDGLGAVFGREFRFDSSGHEA